MTHNQQQQLITEMLYAVERKENDFAIVSPTSDKILLPILSNGGIVRGYEDAPKNWKGIALEVNDHGNVTVLNCFKNGKRNVIASRV